MPKKPSKEKTVKKTSKKFLKKPKSIQERQSGRARSVGQTSQTRIKIIGVGGGGNSIVSEIARLSAGSQWGKNFKKVDFIAINTDLQALSRVSGNCRVVKIGQDLTRGLGCGMDPSLGRMAALKAKEEIRRNLKGADFCLLLSCLGGGAGSGATPVIAEISRSLKQITLGIFTLPFKFEGEKKSAVARNSLKKMKPNLNTVNIIPNERIFQIIKKDTPLKTALSAINQRLTFTLAGLMNMIYSAGLINLDWADFKTVLEERGRRCYLNRVKSSGQDTAQSAAEEVVRNPLNDYGLGGADRILFNIEGDKNLKMQEVEQVSQFIFSFNKKAKIIFGVSIAEATCGKSEGESGVGITLLATGTEKTSGKGSSLPKKKDSAGSLEKKKRAGSNAPGKISTEEDSQPEPKQDKPRENSAKGAVRNKKKKKSRSRKEKRAIPVLSFSREKPAANQKQKAEISPSSEEKPKSETSRVKTVRKNALTLKKEIEKAEKEILAAEKKWEAPAFLRKNK